MTTRLIEAERRLLAKHPDLAEEADAYLRLGLNPAECDVLLCARDAGLSPGSALLVANRIGKEKCRHDYELMARFW